MNPQNEKCQTGQSCNRPHSCNQQRQNQQSLTEEKIKEIILETLIELNIVPKPQRKKGLSTE